jgi:ribose-phosphate pyrophosphokinase
MTHQQQQRMSSQAERGPMKKIVFYCPEMEKMAREVRANDPDAVELGTIKWRRFPDGYPNIFIDNADDIRGRHVAFLASFHDAATIFEQISVVYSLPKMFVASFTLILPFFPTGTFERVDKEGEVPTAVTLARMLSNIPSSRGGPTSTIIFDIHALQERFYFGDGVSPLFESGIPLLLEQLAELKRGDAGKEEIAIAYPDEGACKRFHGFFEDEFTEVVCTKVREGDKRIVTLKEGNPLNKHVVIVDDLVQSGGTLIECMRLLKAKGATKVSAYVTHGVFPNSSWKKFTEPSDASERFEHFFITDSCPLTVDAVNGQSPFRVMSLAGSIARALRI